MNLRKAAKWSFILSWGQQGITGLMGLVLAAILGPADYGTVAMALVCIFLMQLTADQGIGAALVQRSQLEQDHLDTSFWWISGICFLFAVVISLLADLWGRVNDLPSLGPVLVALSPLVILKGLAVVPLSLFRRDLNFRALALAVNVSAGIGGTIGIAAAIAGAGVWALVAQQLISEGAMTLLVWRASAYRPSFHFSWGRLVDLFPFGSGAFLDNLGAFLRNRSDALLMGIFFGPVTVGLYRLADRIVNLVLGLLTRPLTALALPYFSQSQSDPLELKRAVRRLVGISATITIPAMGLLAGSSEAITELIGSEWMPATIALSLLCSIGVIYSVSLFIPQLLQSIGRPHLAAALTWASAAFSVSIFVAMAIHFRDADVVTQLIAISVSRVLVSFIIFLPFSLWLLVRYSGMSIGDVLGPAFVPFTIGLIGFGFSVYFSALEFVQSAQPLLKLVAVSGATSGIMLIAMAIVGRKHAAILISRWRNTRQGKN